MKLTRYEDVTSIRQVKKVEIASGIELEIQDLPPTYTDMLRARLPEPVPPKLGPAREGGRHVRDERNRIVYEYNESDPKYLEALAIHSLRCTVFFLLEGVAPGQMEFNAVENGSWPDYYDAVLEELIEFGWGMGQLNLVAEAVRELSRIDEAAVEQRVREDFA